MTEDERILRAVKRLETQTPPTELRCRWVDYMKRLTRGKVYKVKGWKNDNPIITDDKGNTGAFQRERFVVPRKKCQH